MVQFSLEGTLPGQGIFHWYETVFDDPAFRSSFWLSIQISLETVALSLVLMVPTVFWIHLRLPRLRPVMDLITILPFVVPPIVLIVGLAPFLKNFTWLYVRPEVLAFIYVVFALPFLYRALDAGLRAIDMQTLVEAAESLGSSIPATLFRVIIPNLRAAIIGGSLLTVAISMGEFTVASLIGFVTFPVYTYEIADQHGLRGRRSHVHQLRPRLGGDAGAVPARPRRSSGGRCGDHRVEIWGVMSTVELTRPTTHVRQRCRSRSSRPRHSFR